MKVKLLAVIVVVLACAGVAGVYAGIYNVAADDPHWGITYRVLETARDRSIAVRAPAEVPDLSNEALIAEGAHHYDEMCTECHLAPGMSNTELRAGLYPQPPELAKHAKRLSPAQAFWVTKHGLKMTGMPAWGRTHDDMEIWGLVAFLQRLPGLTEAEYKALADARGRGRGRGGRDDDDARGEDDHHGRGRGGDDHSHSDDAPHHH
jgi:mono/diheme cytochrome c family protein